MRHGAQHRRRQGTVGLVGILAAAVLLLAVTTAEAEDGESDLLRGTVTDTLSGEPLDGVPVMIFGAPGPSGPSPVGETRTDGGGVYEFPDVGSPYAIGVHDEPGYEMEFRRLDLSGEGPHVVDLDVYPSTGEPRVLGRLVDARTGELVASARKDVFLHFAEPADPLRAFTPWSVGYPGQLDRRPERDDLTFAFYRLEAGDEVHVEAHASGYAAGAESEVVAYDGETPLEITIGMTPHFTDVEAVADDGSHAAAIGWLADAGIVGGHADGSYRPWEDVSRGEMATFLHRSLPDLPDADLAFPDVDPGSAHAPAIAAIAEAGVTTGFADGTFRPYAPVTRGQMAMFLMRGLDLEAAVPEFADVTVEHPYAEGIGAVAEAGITTGYADGTFRPSASISRAEMASMLRRALEP